VEGAVAGRKIYDDKGQPAIKVIKGRAGDDPKKDPYQVDGLSGATITSNGVTTMKFWFGPDGFAALKRFKASPKPPPAEGRK
jgi:Na+-transporting NADH:ubiquinone oxidoreductase subunit C